VVSNQNRIISSLDGILIEAAVKKCGLNGIAETLEESLKRDEENAGRVIIFGLMSAHGDTWKMICL
jgi:hypothetical protein